MYSECGISELEEEPSVFASNVALAESARRLVNAFEDSCDSIALKIENLGNCAANECSRLASDVDDLVAPEAAERAALLQALLADINEAETRVLHMEQLAAFASSQRQRVRELEKSI